MPIADDVRAASEAGIITAGQAESLVTFLSQRAASAAPAEAVAPAVANAPADADADPDAENVRFVRGFQDVLLTIGIVLLLLGIGVFGASIVPRWNAELGAAAVSYALAVAFARRWRLVLPSMALAVGFTAFTCFGVAHYLGGTGSLLRFGTGDFQDPLFIGTLTAFGAALVFYVSFRLPFALAMIALSALAIVFAGLHVWFGVNDYRDIWAPVLLGFGLLTFVVAMAFDMSDPLRKTLRADSAFWLHLSAAPMIVHAIVTMAVSTGRTAFTPGDAVVVIALVLVFALVALVIDRRALFVSALGYFGFAIAGLVRQADLDVGGAIAITLALTGAAVVALGAGWRGLRRFMLGGLPRTGILLRLPPVGNPAS